MVLNTDLHASPYFDDYDEDKYPLVTITKPNNLQFANSLVPNIVNGYPIVGMTMIAIPREAIVTISMSLNVGSSPPPENTDLEPLELDPNVNLATVRSPKSLALPVVEIVM
jgi:hypothetical protein